MLNQIEQARLKELVTYDPDTGIFTFNKNGKEAGWKQRGYIKIALDGKHFYAHRLAWIYMTGTNPEGDIDHINQVGTDNRFVNLRKASRAQNRVNTTSRIDNRLFLKGVSLRSGMFEAKLGIGEGKQILLGSFDTMDEAAHAYNKAAIAHYGEFACLNPIGFDKRNQAEMERIRELEDIVEGLTESLADMRNRILEEVASMYDSSPNAEEYRSEVAKQIRSLKNKEKA